MPKYNNKIILLFSLLILFIFIFPYYPQAQTLKDIKAQQEDIKGEIEETKQQLKAMENQTKTIETQIKELDYKTMVASSELNQVIKELEILTEEIKETEILLKEAEKNIENKNDIFNKRLRTMYKNGNATYLEVLLSSKNIKDFLSRQEMIQSIADYDKELIAYMKEQRNLIKERKTELQAKRSSIEITKSNIEKKKVELEQTSREKEFMMSKLSEDIKAFEKEYDKLNDLAKDIESKIVKLQSSTGIYSGGKMGWPVPGHSRISSPYGYRIHPIFKVKKLHTGIDIPAPTGTSIVAAAAGKVIYSGWLGGYGNVIMLDHGGKVVTLYAHNSSLVVKEGKDVKRGDVIAKAGSTGNSTGPHLHFEVRNNGAYVDPLPWLKK